MIPIRLHVYTFVVAASLSSTYFEYASGTRLRVWLLAAASVSSLNANRYKADVRENLRVEGCIDG